MPTTFNVISVGNLADIDTNEGNNTAENASALVGMTFGGIGDSLANDFVEMSPVSPSGPGYYTDNDPDNTFSIDGGAPQIFDSIATYNATVTYIDGTTATITMVLFQDVDGNTYLAPEMTANADQAALEAGPIRSITLDSLENNNVSGLAVDREAWDYVTCFVRGTKIETSTGLVAVDDLKAGDLVKTVDNDFQPLRWVGSRKVQATGAFAPVKISKGALGNTEDLFVSPQHRVLLSGWRAELHFGIAEVLAPAIGLVNGDTIIRKTDDEVEYFHIMFDKHELVYSAGIQTESFHPGHMAWEALSENSRDEILALFPELRNAGIAAYGEPARSVVRPYEVKVING